MKIDVAIDFSKKTLFNKNDKAVKRAIKGTAREFHRLARPYTPFRTGDMDRTSDFSDFEKGEVVWDKPYAHYIYYAPETTKLTTKHHEDARIRWGQFVKAKYQKDLEEVFDRYLKG